MLCCSTAMLTGDLELPVALFWLMYLGKLIKLLLFSVKLKAT